MSRNTPPKPPSRPDGAGVLTRLRLFQKDMFRSQPERLYGAKMAEMRVPLWHSFFLNTPDLVAEVLEQRPDAFPKARIIGETLRPLLGQSVFVTNGPVWKRQRRLIDPAFGAANVKRAFPAMQSAADAAVARLDEGPREMEFKTAHLAADVIFRTLFSIPITEMRAAAVFSAFQAYQRAQPLLSPAALLRLPHWWPRRRRGGAAAREIRALLGVLVEERIGAIATGTAPDDLATAILDARDPETGEGFSREEMLDQVAIFFLAGHETSASALSWALYCLAADPMAQTAVAEEVTAVSGDGPIRFEMLPRLKFTRDVFRETLRLYPPVPMMVRETVQDETFRGRKAGPGALAILSPWHLHRHKDIWPDPDVFDPWRWQREETKPCAQAAWMPFSRGPRVCTGAGFAMIEGVVLLATLIRAFEFQKTDAEPVPVAHLTVRSEAGIMLNLSKRSVSGRGNI